MWRFGYGSLKLKEEEDEDEEDELSPFSLVFSAKEDKSGQEEQNMSWTIIIFEGNVYIPVGDNYKEKFNDYINKMCLGK